MAGNSDYVIKFPLFDMPWGLMPVDTINKFPSVWQENTPSTLFRLCLKYCINNPRTFCHWSNSEGYILASDIILPEVIAEQMACECRRELDVPKLDYFMNIFKDTKRTRLRFVEANDSELTDRGLQIVCNHPIVRLNISGCRSLTRRVVNSVKQMNQTLVSLNVGANSRIFSDDYIQRRMRESSDHSFHEHMTLLNRSKRVREKHKAIQEMMNNTLTENLVMTPDGEMQATAEVVNAALATLAASSREKLKLEPYFSQLRTFIMHGITEEVEDPCFMSFIRDTHYMTFLDLSKCYLPPEFEYIYEQENLQSLILCDVVNVRVCLSAVKSVKSLKYLDISNTLETTLSYNNPNEVLTELVNSLPNLTSLDISGTNLAGSRTVSYTKESLEAIKNMMELNCLTDIPGLVSRRDNPLEFLGLLNTAHEACYRHHIPARIISGDANEAQTLVAGQMYINREPMIQKVLNQLFQSLRFSTVDNIRLALDIVLAAMEMHLKSKNIQVSASASLFYMVKSDIRDQFNIRIKRRIIRTLTNAMFLHHSDFTMLRNGCLTLIHFRIPDDIFFDYERLSCLLLLIVEQDDQDEFVQRISIYLLNSLACQVDGIEKKILGGQGLISIMLQLIEKRLQRNICDEVMETAWSTMWNVTDETPVNCKRFLDGNGMDLFIGCMKSFPQRAELLRNMMGLLGNVAEVKELRPYLMKDDFLTVFCELLNSKSDGIEVSYNAAGILSHILSDGAIQWREFNIVSITREHIMTQMVKAIESWNIKSKRNINYRSFQPILRLLRVHNIPEAHLWAVWALANLTLVYPEKYCELLKEEGGLLLLQSMIEQHQLSQIRSLAEIAHKHTTEYLSEGGDQPFESDDEDDEDEPYF